MSVRLHAVLEGKSPRRPPDDLVGRFLAFECAANRLDDLSTPQKQHAALVAAGDLQTAGAFADAAKLDDVHQIELVELASKALLADQISQPGGLRTLVQRQFVGERVLSLGRRWFRCLFGKRRLHHAGTGLGQRIREGLWVDRFVENGRAVDVGLVFAEVVTGDEDRPQRGLFLLQGFTQVKTVHSLQHHFGDQHVRRLPWERVNACCASANGVTSWPVKSRRL